MSVKTQVGLYDIDGSIDRPIAIQLSNDIKNKLSMSKDVYVKFNNEDTFYLNPELDKLGEQVNDNTTKKSYIQLNVVEEAVQNSDHTTKPDNPNHDVIYKDDDIGSKILPIYNKREKKIEFSYYDRSKSKVQALVNKLRMMVANSDYSAVHDLSYRMTLPRLILQLLVEINDKKNNYLNNPLSLEEYINSTFKCNVDAENSLDGFLHKSSIVIKEVQAGVYGSVTSDIGSIKIEQDKDTKLWFFMLEYNITYSKPVSLFVEYPIMIFNQYINDKFTNFIGQNRIPRKGTRVLGETNLDHATRDNSTEGFDFSKNYLHFPSIDKIDLGKPDPYMARVMALLVTVSEDDPNDLFNLFEGIEFLLGKPMNSNFKDLLLSSEYPYVGKRYMSLFYFSLFKDGEKDYDNEIIMDSEGNLRTSLPMDIKSTYRIVFDIVVDTSIIMEPARSRIKDFLEEEYNYKQNQQVDNLENRNMPQTGQVKKETFLETYVNLLSIPENEVYRVLGKVPYQDMIFSIKKPDWAKFYKTQVHISEVALFDKE